MVDAKRSPCCKNVTKSGFSVSPGRFTGSTLDPRHRKHLSDLCLKISPKLSRIRLVNNNVLSLRLAGEYWREVCGASRRSGPAFAGGRSAVAGRSPCLLLLRSQTCYLPHGEPQTPPTIRSSPEQMFLIFCFVLCMFHVYSYI